MQLDPRDIYYEPSLGTRQQPHPTKSRGHPPIWELVRDDLQHRKEMGEQQYGTVLQPHNGRDALLDLYQELLDSCLYLRQHLYERYGY